MSNGYCLDNYDYVCNGLWECLYGEDELYCVSGTDSIDHTTGKHVKNFYYHCGKVLSFVIWILIMMDESLNPQSVPNSKVSDHKPCTKKKEVRLQ